MQMPFQRIQMLLTDQQWEHIQQAHILVVGLGGVGGQAVEALARSGIGYLTLVDYDKVASSNINRQIIATKDTLGQFKTEIFKKRIESINPDCKVTLHTKAYQVKDPDGILNQPFDYIIDAIDQIKAKVDLIIQAHRKSIPIVSAMGMGNRFDPSQVVYRDIYDTDGCPFARKVRSMLRKENIQALETVFSLERPSAIIHHDLQENARINGSNALVPSTAGLFLAARVIEQIKQDKR